MLPLRSSYRPDHRELQRTSERERRSDAGRARPSPLRGTRWLGDRGQSGLAAESQPRQSSTLSRASRAPRCSPGPPSNSIACSPIFSRSRRRTSPSRWPGHWSGVRAMARQARNHDQGRGVAAVLPGQPADVGVGHEAGVGPDAIGIEARVIRESTAAAGSRSRGTSSARRRRAGRAAAGRTRRREQQAAHAPRQWPG